MCNTIEADLLELSLTNSVSIENDAVWLEPRTLVEINQHLSNHSR